MSFASIEFIFYFLIIFFLGYYLVPSKLKNAFLLIASLFFYIYNDLKSLPILLIVALINYLLTFRLKNNLCLLSAILDALFLIYIKVFTDLSILGVSFFIFKQIYYSLDIRRYETLPQENIINYLMYSFMFVNIISGPIVRYSDIVSEIDERKPQIFEGFSRFVLGLIEKVLIGDSLSRLYNQLINLSTKSLVNNLFSVFIFSLYLYLDFKSYSSMALGIGKMLGFNFKENFNYPYCSLSISEFFNRWHISLGTFFKNNIYIPLGGNKKGLVKQIIAIFIVWLLTGLWHGVTIPYILWGIFFGVIISLEKIFSNEYEKLNNIIKRIYVLITVYVGWAIFSNNNIFDYVNIYDSSILFFIRNYFIEIILAIILSTPIIKNFLNKKHHIIIDILISIIIICLFILTISSILNNSYTPFLYAGF